ncbi:hypothetical protein PFISCL1PPCAC_5152 [Pristionchus fissidentatus]|uniref:F-box domain-containing protein n=1 Tax=Pristionchus fissidentatus TaxID=1538716 RepID=A0AAV5V5P0_9BILA|nr:hypothetical protein PFISCL1PPCAC_5152 [Pristionchus fissidentatus]
MNNKLKGGVLIDGIVIKLTLTHLPEEILVIVYSYLSVVDRLNTSVTCRRLYEMELKSLKRLTREEFSWLDVEEIRDQREMRIKMSRKWQPSHILTWRMHPFDAFHWLQLISAGTTLDSAEWRLNFLDPVQAEYLDIMPLLEVDRIFKITHKQSKDAYVANGCKLIDVIPNTQVKRMEIRNLSFLSGYFARFYNSVRMCPIGEITWFSPADSIRNFTKEVLGMDGRFFARGKRDNFSTSRNDVEVYRSAKSPYDLRMIDGWKVTHVSRKKSSVCMTASKHGHSDKLVRIQCTAPKKQENEE